MMDFLIPMKMYEYVMGNAKIKNKFLGYFWRVAAICASAYVVILALAIVISGGGAAASFSAFQAAVLALTGLAVCVGFPAVSFFLVRKYW